MVLAPLNPNKISSFMQRQERGCARSNRWWMQALCRLASYSAFLPLLNDSCVLWWQKNNADNSVRFQSHGDSLKYCGWSRHMWRSKKKGKKVHLQIKQMGFCSAYSSLVSVYIHPFNSTYPIQGHGEAGAYPRWLQVGQSNQSIQRASWCTMQEWMRIKHM